MSMNENQDNNSNLVLDLENDNQIFETSTLEIPYRWKYFMFPGIYGMHHSLSSRVLFQKSLDGGKIIAAIRVVDCSEYLQFNNTSNAEKDICPHKDFYSTCLQTSSHKTPPQPTKKLFPWTFTRNYAIPIGWRQFFLKEIDMCDHSSWLRCYHDTKGNSDRYDDLVDRYHNNVHFMKRRQLIMDLIISRLPTSVHSQSTMLGAFAARSSQVDYGERKQIEEFCLKYGSLSLLDEYTKDSFFYRVVNSVLRQKRYDIIYQYRHAIIDIIERLRRPLPSEDDSVSLILYRGQHMTIFEVEKLKNNIGEAVTCSSFLSTSLSLKIAQVFAGDGSGDNPCLVSVICKIHLNTGQPTRPYALIDSSAEDEVLLSPGTKFIVMSCRKLHDNGRLWIIELKAIAEKQQEQLKLNHGETFLLLSSTSGWPTSVVVVQLLIT